jgi:hypothetical protein
MQYFDPSEQGEPSKCNAVAPRPLPKKREIVSSERSGQWEPLGAVTCRIVERLLADQDGAPHG